MAGFNHNWLLVPLVVAFSIWITRGPEVRPHRWKFFAGILAMGALVLFVALNDNPTYLVLLFLLVRPVVFVGSFLVGDVINENIAGAVIGTVFGSHQHQVTPQKANYDRAIDFRKGGEPQGAIECLRRNVKKHPEDFDSHFLIAQIYAEDCDDLPKAEQTVREILASEWTRKDCKAYATKKLNEWRARCVKKKDAFVVTPVRDFTPLPPAPPPPPPVELVGVEAAKANRDAGRFGSAIEALNLHLGHCPEDFEASLLLATIYADNCSDLPQARKVTEKILRGTWATADQKARAETKLKEWRLRAG